MIRNCLINFALLSGNGKINFLKNIHQPARDLNRHCQFCHLPDSPSFSIVHTFNILARLWFKSQVYWQNPRSRAVGVRNGSGRGGGGRQHDSPTPRSRDSETISGTSGPFKALPLETAEAETQVNHYVTLSSCSHLMMA